MKSISSGTAGSHVFLPLWPIFLPEMDPKYYHVNLDRTLDGVSIWTPDSPDPQDLDSQLTNLFTTDNGWSPEHLFIASVAAGILKTFLQNMSREKIDMETVSIRSTGKSEHRKGGVKLSEIILVIDLEVESEEVRERVEQVLRNLTEACTVCKSVNVRIRLRPLIEVGVMII